MTAGNDIFKAILADTSPFIVKGWLVPVYIEAYKDLLQTSHVQLKKRAHEYS